MYSNKERKQTKTTYIYHETLEYIMGSCRSLFLTLGSCTQKIKTTTKQQSVLITCQICFISAELLIYRGGWVGWAGFVMVVAQHMWWVDGGN